MDITTRKIDGNDLSEIIAVSSELIDQCRKGKGPVILECMTYRWRGHVGPSWDEDVGLKRKDELKDWLDKDPIKREKNRLIKVGYTLEELDTIEKKLVEENITIVSNSRKANFPDPSTLLDNLYC